MQRNQHGAVSGVLIALIFMTLLFIGAGTFGIWAFGSRQDYKNNVDQKIATAVAAAQQTQKAADAAQATLEANKTLKPYNGPSAYGSIVINYPKAWSAYVNETDNSGTPLDGYFQPDYVPSTTSQTQTFATRLQVVQQSYDQVLNAFTELNKEGKVTVTPFKPAMVANVIGVRVDGEIEQQKQGSMIILPLRDKTFKLWTEAQNYETVFNNNILPNFTFSP